MFNTKKPSHRLDKVATLIKRAISDIFLRDLDDPHIDFKFVSVSDITLSKDLSSARIYVSQLSEEHKEKTIESLNKAAGFIRKKLSSRLDLRIVPKLSFHLDETIQYGQKLSKLIDDANQTKSND